LEALMLKLDFDSLRVSDKGSITGDVWVELGEKSFPEQNWSDVPTAVTSAFLDAAVRLKRAAGTVKEKVWFLDGPCYVALQCAKDPTWLVSLRNLDGVLYAEAEVNGSASFASIRAGAVALVSECAARSWQHPDVRILNGLLNASA
jgi:hypothetical protein